MALMKFLVQQDVTPGLVHLWEVLDAVFPLWPFLWCLGHSLVWCWLHTVWRPARPLQLRPFIPTSHSILPFGRPAALQTKPKGNLRCSFIAVHEEGARELPWSGTGARFAFVAQFWAGHWLGTDSLACPQAHEFWNQAYIAVLQLLRCLRTVFVGISRGMEAWFDAIHRLFYMLKWALGRRVIYCGNFHPSCR